MDRDSQNARTWGLYKAYIAAATIAHDFGRLLRKIRRCQRKKNMRSRSQRLPAQAAVFGLCVREAGIFKMGEQ